MEITNGEIVINRTIDREKKKKRKKENVEKLLVRVRKLQRGQRVFRAKRVFSPSRFHASLSFVYDALITYPVVGPQLNSTYRSLEKEGKRRGEEVGKFFSLPDLTFSLCALSSRGLFLKLVGIGVIHGAGSFHVQLFSIRSTTGL